MRFDQRRQGCLVHIWCLNWHGHEDGDSNEVARVWDGDGNNDSERVHACVCEHTRRGGKGKDEDACVREGEREGWREGQEGGCGCEGMRPRGRATARGGRT